MAVPDFRGPVPVTDGIHRLVFVPLVASACSCGTVEPSVNASTGDVGDTTSGAEVDISLEMAEVPEGLFEMGCVSAQDDRMCSDEPGDLWLEIPLRQVTLSRFWIDRTEVTYEHYLPCVLEKACTGSDSVPDVDGLTDAMALRLPVQGVTWEQASTYCGWRGARLATEAEWEKAARGDDGRLHPWGNLDAKCGEANLLYDTIECDQVRRPVPVGTRPEDVSPYGAYDMAGNVQEWVSDWAGRDYYQNGPLVDPSGPAEPDSQYPYRVIRGFRHESWFLNERTFNRAAVHPDTAVAGVGFRCASSVDPAGIADPRLE